MTSENPFRDCETVDQLIGELIGAASMCWENVRAAGVFQSDQARELIDHAKLKLAHLQDKPKDQKKFIVTAEVEFTISANSPGHAYNVFTQLVSEVFNQAWSTVEDKIKGSPMFVPSNYYGLSVVKTDAQT